MNLGGLTHKLIWLVPMAAVMLIGGFVVIRLADTSHGELPTLGDIPRFTMTDQDGQPFDRDDLNGVVTVVSFMYTSCPSVCPVMSKNIAAMYHDFAGSNRVRFVSITVDPARDTIEALKLYASSWGVTDNRWLFLRAPIDSVVWLSETGFLLGADDLPDGHTFRLTLLDERGHIRGYYNGLEDNAIARLRRDIRKLVEELS